MERRAVGDQGARSFRDVTDGTLTARATVGIDMTTVNAMYANTIAP